MPSRMVGQRSAQNPRSNGIGFDLQIIRHLGNAGGAREATAVRRPMTGWRCAQEPWGSGYRV
jgi:hypothetical protein